jgi:hypothetical protein
MTQRLWWLAVSAMMLALGARAGGAPPTSAGEEKACPKCAAKKACADCPKVGCVKEKVAELLKQFRTLYQAGKYVEAERMAMKAQKLDPDDVAADAAVKIAQYKQRLTQCGKCTANCTAAECKEQCCDGSADCCKKGGCCAAVKGRAACAACQSKCAAAEMKSAVAAPPPPVPPFPIMAQLPPGLPLPPPCPPLYVPATLHYPAPVMAASPAKLYLIEARLVEMVEPVGGKHVTRFPAMQVTDKYHVLVRTYPTEMHVSAKGAGEPSQADVTLTAKVRPVNPGKVVVNVSLSESHRFPAKRQDQTVLTNGFRIRRTISTGKWVKLLLMPGGCWLEMCVKEEDAGPSAQAPVMPTSVR